MKTCQPSINETKHPGKKRGGGKGQDWRTQFLAKCYFSVYYYYLKGFPQNKNPKGLFIPSGGDPRIFIRSCVPMRKRVNYMLGGSHTCEFLMRFRNTLKWPFLSFGEPTCSWTSSLTQCNVGVLGAALCSISFTGEFLPNFKLKKYDFNLYKGFFSWEKIICPNSPDFEFLKKIPNCKSLIITSTNVAKNIEGFLFLILKPSYLLCSQIWINYLLGDHHFGYITKSLKETLKTL